MTELTPFLAAVRERLAKATPYQHDLLPFHLMGEPGNPISEFINHAPTDLARLLALAKAGQEVIEIASDLNCQHEPKKHVRRGTGNLCDWCGFAWPCDVVALTDALTRYQAAVQEATRDA